jgi:ubiquinone/menaquinone biosynthesis C-methylase UbiE
MSYTIDEQNAERQQLLATILEPPTRDVLARLPTLPSAHVLDIGCGQGHTTRLLAKVLAPASCIGLDFDDALVAYAAARADNPKILSFRQGDATHLPFADGAFDVVFCRFLLIHMTDAVRVIREMLRVAKPGGFVVAFEADFAYEIAYPPEPTLGIINRIWQGMFQDPSAGRKLVSYFRAAGVREIQSGAAIQLEHDASTLKRTYRLTGEATAPAAVAKGVITEVQAREMIDGLTRLEHDPASVLIRFPDIWAIGRS